MATILDQIVAERRVAVKESRARRKLSELETLASERPAPRSLRTAFLSIEEAKVADSGASHRVISEVKRASPSKGLIREDFDPLAIAKSYEKGGAAAISVLTEEKHFQGSLDYLKTVAAQVALPVLRKDFFVDPYQVIEARAHGAAAILLIVACTERGLSEELLHAAGEYGLDVLVEVHTRAELDEALDLGEGLLLGINNRNLHTFETSLQTTLDLIPHVPADRKVIAESGLNTKDDLDQLRTAGAGGFLIGESLMRAPDPGAMLAELIGKREDDR